jgi:hypothetical protein
MQPKIPPRRNGRTFSPDISTEAAKVVERLHTVLDHAKTVKKAAKTQP